MTRPQKREAEYDVFHALGDAKRRRMLELLADREHDVQQMAGHFKISLAAVSQHLQVLHEAKLVRRQEAGRRRIYAIDPAGLTSARNWLDDVAKFWTEALDRLEAHLEADKH